MSHRMVGVLIVAGMCGWSWACGGGPDASVVGPSAVGATGAAVTGPGPGGSGGGPAGNGSVNGVIRVRCEVRSGRSKISVDGNNLQAGTYAARVTSGTNHATAPAKATLSDEVEFDFDSNRNDVAEGATAISLNFIQNARVQADLLDGAGALVASATGSCSTR
jgi:hypothetical protein